MLPFKEMKNFFYKQTLFKEQDFIVSQNRICVNEIFRQKLERVMGIEPTTTAWKAVVLPLNYTRINKTNITIMFQPQTEVKSGRQDSNLRPLGPKPSALPS